MISTVRELLDYYRWQQQLPTRPLSRLRVWFYRRFFRLALDRDEVPQVVCMRRLRFLRSIDRR